MAQPFCRCKLLLTKLTQQAEKLALRFSST
jgi:hypothetical protein